MKPVKAAAADVAATSLLTLTSLLGLLALNTLTNTSINTPKYIENMRL